MKTKEKLLAVLLALTVFILAFTSCNLNGDNTSDDQGGNNPGTSQGGGNNGGSDNTGGGNGDNTPEQKFVMAPGTEVRVVMPEGMTIPGGLSDAIISATGVAPVMVTGDAEASEHEIIIGAVRRTLADRAYRALDDMDLSQKTDIYSGWVIYSGETSLAIAYDTDVALDLAIEELIKSISAASDGKLIMAAGKAASDNFDLYDKYDELSAAIREEEFAALKAYVDSLGYDGEALVTSVKQLYSLYTNDAYIWLANLYDPGVGGFYYSNSARETVGFLPDIESTNQALNFITNTRMQSNLNANLPKEIKAQIVSFVKGLQSSEDGYFYHPQWVDYTLTDNRRGRDLNWAEDVLRRFGEKPLYDTPNGVKGSVGAPGQNSETQMTSSLRASVASLVSKVKPTAVDHLASEEAFLEYIQGLNWENGSYGPGNTIGSQAQQIKNAGLGDVCINFLNGLSDPETGMFEKFTGYADEAVNGFLKVSGVYITMGAPIPNAAAAAKTCIDTLTSDAYCATVCFVYNAWFSIGNIIGSLNSSADPADKAAAEEIRDQVRTNAAEYILVGARKYAEFRKDDGSFSYTPDQTSALSQGMPVALQEMNEGDVNATNISVAGVTGYLFGALGYKDYMPSIYTKYDWIRFAEEISMMEPVIKTRFSMHNAADFEDEDITVDDIFGTLSRVDTGIDPSELEDKTRAYAYITTENNNNVLHFGKNDYGNEAYIGKGATGFKGSKYTLELKLKYDGSEMKDGLESWNSRFSMYYDGGRFWYVLMYPKANGKLAVGDFNNPTALLDPGVWYTLTFEYFADANVCHLYVNGTHIGKVGTVDGSKNDASYARALLELRNQAKISYYMDDILVKKENEAYVEPPLEIGDATGDFYKNAANKGSRYDYDAMFATAPGVNKYATAALENGNLVFKKLNGDGESYLQYAVAANSTLETPILIYETDVKFTGLTEANFGKIRLYSRDKEITFTTTLKDGIVTITPMSGANSLGKKLEIPVEEWHNIRFEVDYTSESIHMFLDNEHVTTYTDVSFTSASGSRKILIYLYKAETQGAIEMDNLFYGLVEDGSFETKLPEGEEPGTEPEIVLPPAVTGTENNGKGAYYSGAIAGISAITKDYASGTAPKLEIGGTRAPSAVTEIADGILKYYKTNTDNEEYFKQNYTAPETALTNGVAIWEADLQFGNATAGALGRTTICINQLEVVIGLHVGTDGKLYFGPEKTVASNSPALEAGKWYNVRFEYYYHEITAAGANGVVKVYVNNEFACTMTGVGVNSRNWTDVRNLVYLATEQKSAYMFIDNLYLGFADKVREPDPAPKEDATGDLYLSDKEGTRVDYDAPDAVFPAGSKANDANSIVIQGGSLVYSKVTGQSASEGFVRWNITPVENLQTPVLVFEADIKFSGIASTTFAKILLETNGLTTQINVNHSGDKITFVPMGSGATGSVSISEKAWHNVRFELDYAAKTIAVFVDNKYVSSFENVVLGSKPNYNRILFYMLAGETTGSVSFDNVYYGVLEEGSEIVVQEDDATGKYFTDDKTSGTRLDYDKADATAPTISGTDTTLGIVDGSLVLGRVEGAETYTDSGFQSMVIGSFTGLTTPVLIVEADMKFDGFNAAAGKVAGWIRLFSNDLEIRILVGHDGDNVVFSAENATGTVSVAEGKWQNVRFEIDYANNDIYVFVDNVQAGVIADPLTRAASGSRKLMYYLCKDETAGKISMDNIYAGVLEDGNFIIPAEDASEKGAYYTDENKTGTRLDYDKADVTAPTIGGTDTTLGIVDGSLVLGRIEGEETYTDNGFKATDIGSFTGLTTPVLIVEADMKFEGFNAAKGTVAGWIRLFSNDLEIRILVGHDGDNIIFSAENATGTVSVAEGKWQNVRFEIDYANKDIYVFVDNVQAGVIADPLTRAASGSRKLMYYLCKDETAGKIYMDNIYAGVLEDGSFTPPAPPAEPEAPDVPTSDATGDYYLSDKAGTRVDYDAEGATVPTGSGTNAQNAIAVTDGSLVYSKVAGQTGKEGYARWNVTAVSGLTTPVFVFEMDVKFENVASATFGKILLEANELTTQITVNHSGDKITFVPASGSATGSVSITEGVWTNVRFELDYTEKLINVFVNNVYAGSLKNVSIGTKTGYNRVMFYMLAGETAASISFDNIYYAILEDGTELPKEDATGDNYLSETKGYRVNYDVYGTAIPAFQSGSATATLTATDGSLEFKKTEKGESTFRWIPGQSKTSDIYVYEADMKFSNVTSTTPGWIKIAACDKLFTVTIDHKDDNVTFYVGDVSKGASVKENEWVNVRIEVDFANKIAVLCINNEFAYAWENISLDSASGSQYVRFSLTSSANVNDTIYYDNLFCGFVSATTERPSSDENA